jgi:Lon protease-like protein
LITECFHAKKTFGIPVVMNNKVSEKGTLMEVIEISKVYDNGEMDIKTKGISIFNMLEMVKEIPDKLYSGAIVNYQPNYQNGSASMMKKIIESTRKFHTHLEVSKDFGKPDEELNSYDIAHHMGLSIEEEFQILSYENELHRQEFLKRHITKMLSVVEEMQSLKKKIQLNGHFKNLEGFEF